MDCEKKKTKKPHTINEKKCGSVQHSTYTCMFHHDTMKSLTFNGTNVKGSIGNELK